MRYVIKWRGLVSGRTGVGSVHNFEGNARREVARLNRKYGELIEHWYEPLGDPLDDKALIEAMGADPDQGDV